jgi:hypothetical protein
MKIYQLLDSVQLSVTNEENKFISKHQNKVRLSALDEHDSWLAQNLVRKGVYKVSKDNNTLIKNVNEINSR